MTCSMKSAMKTRFVVPALLLSLASISHGQAVPAGSSPITSFSAGPNLPNLDGVLHYSLSASEIFQFGYNGPGVETHSTTLSGNLAYTAKSEVRPFNLVLSGGYFVADQQFQGNSGYAGVSVSQGYVTRTWVFNITDSFSFLPQSPTTGLSGIPGVGDLGATPVQGPVEGPAGGILSTSGNRISNLISGSVEHQITRDTSLSGSGSWSKLKFLDDDVNGDEGFEPSSVSGTVAINRHISARSSASVNAVYSTYSYGLSASATPEPDIETRGINGAFQYLLSRTLSVSVSAGPQWISSSNSILVPSRLNTAATAGLSYQRGFTSGAVSFSRGANGGSGVLPGAVGNSVSGSLGHTFGRNWVAAVNAAYTHSSGLTEFNNGTTTGPENLVYNTVFGGAQLTRRISTHFSAYVSYNAQNQTSNTSVVNANPQNALNGTSQNLGIGITFTPRSTRLGQF